MRVGWAVDSDGVATALEVSPEVDAAQYLLTDAGVPPDKAARIAFDAERHGQNPEHFARHFLRLRAAANLA